MRFAAALGAAVLLTAGPAAAQAPVVAEPAWKRCQALVEAEKIAEAEPFCVQGAKEDPIVGGSLYGQYLQFFAKKPDQAMIEYRKVRQTIKVGQTPNESQLLALRGIALLNLPRGIGLSDADEYLKHQPDDREVLFLAAQKDDSAYGGEPKYADRLVALEPKAFEPHVLRSRTFLAREKPEKALEAAQAAIALAPKEPFALQARAEAYMAGGKLPESIRDYNTLAGLAPKEAWPLVGKASAQAQQEKYADAIATATQALRIKPDDTEGLKVRAASYIAMGEGEKALADLRHAEATNKLFGWPGAVMRAEEIIEAQALFTPKGVAQLEADRLTLKGVLLSDLRSTCGYFDISDGNEGVDHVNECFPKWRTSDLSDAFDGAQAKSALDRLEDAYDLLEVATDLACSSMPSRSRCLNEALIARVEAAVSGFDDKKVIVQVSNEEIARINAAVESHNSSVRFQDRVNGYTAFMRGLSEALAEQSGGY